MFGRYRELRRLARRLLGDHGEAEDVVTGDLHSGSAGERCWAARRRGRGLAAPGLPEHRLQPAPKGRRRTTARLERAGLAERADDKADAGPSPLLDVLRAEQQRAVRQALAALPERQRSRHRAAGYSYAEIAATLDLALGSVGVLLARGERAFREAYLDSDDADPGATMPCLTSAPCGRPSTTAAPRRPCSSTRAATPPAPTP